MKSYLLLFLMVLFIGCSVKSNYGHNNSHLELNETSNRELVKVQARIERNIENLLKEFEEEQKRPDYDPYKYDRERDDKARKLWYKIQKEANKYIQEGMNDKAYRLLEDNPISLILSNVTNARIESKVSLIYFKLKKYLDAYEYQYKSAERFLRLRPDTLKQLSFQGKKKFTNNNEYNLWNLLPIAFSYQSAYPVERKQVIKETFDLWVKVKGDINNIETHLMKIRERTQNKTMKAKIEDLIKVNREYSYLFLKGLSLQEDFSPEDSKRMEKLIRKKEQLEKIVSQVKRYNPYEYMNTENIVDELQGNELYLDFAQTGKYYYLFTADSNDNLTFNRLDKNAYEIDELIKSLRQNIINQKALDEYKKTASTLYKTLFKTIDKRYKKIIISPDGLLNLLPFEALVTNDNKYLMESKDIFYISSGKDLVKFRDNNRHTLYNRKIVLFSDLNYDYEEKKSTSKNIVAMNIDKRAMSDLIPEQGLKRLSATKNESVEIKKLFGKERVFAYTELNGTKEVLYSIKSPQILHFSTHSSYAKSNSQVIDPLLKSGLALSEYDAIFDGDNRGLMTALEFSTLELFNTELVLFASCESGLGDIYSSEGVSGLNRGAKIAGAERVISTLWKIQDQKSVELVHEFYKHLVNNHGGKLKRLLLGSISRETYQYAKALKATKLKMLHLHPYYWAGFVEYGLD